MKKQLMGLAACALILSSCSQNQEIENYEQLNREEVRLAPYVNKSKASVMDLPAMKDANYSGFKVYALQHAPVMNGEVIVDGGLLTNYADGTYDFMTNLVEKYQNNVWSHGADKYYWPETDALSFFAVAPAEGNSISKGNAMTIPVTIKDNVADQIDILAASVLNKTKSTVTSSNGQVDFTFKHILSRIGFKARVADNQNLKFKITAISFTYGTEIVKDGVFTFEKDGIGTIVAGETLHGATTSNIGIMDTKGTIISSTTPVQINANDAYLMLMPQDKSGNLMSMTISYHVAVAGDNYSPTEKTVTINIPVMKYEQGKAYGYNLILSNETGDGLLEIKFGVTDVTSWNEETTPTTPPAGN